MTTEQESMLDECLNAEDAGLTGRELDFIEDLDRRRGRPLTERQLDWLISINAKCI